MKKIIKVKAVKITEETVYIETPFIKLDSLHKLCNIAQTGGHAKMIINDGLVEVNGEICTCRGKKIKPGDSVRFEKTVYKIAEK